MTSLGPSTLGPTFCEQGTGMRVCTSTGILGTVWAGHTYSKWSINAHPLDRRGHLL